MRWRSPQAPRSPTEYQRLLEFSLYDQQGVVTHSSDPRFVKQALPAELRPGLLSHSAALKRMTTALLRFISHRW